MDLYYESSEATDINTILQGKFQFRLPKQDLKEDSTSAA
jgi:hypothetical protein